MARIPPIPNRIGDYSVTRFIKLCEQYRSNEDIARVVGLKPRSVEVIKTTLRRHGIQVPKFKGGKRLEVSHVVQGSVSDGR